jgi:hypothetical protein
MRERDRQDYNTFIRQHAAEEQAREDARLVPIRKAEAELSKTAGKLRAAERKAALNGTNDFETALTLLSDAMKAITPERPISMEQAAAFNEREAVRFAENTPEYYACPDNADLMSSFCSRHGIGVADAETWGNVFRHLDGLGLMQHRPAPQSEPVIDQQPEPTPARAKELMGVDESGRPKAYTPAEVDRMSADEYKRFFRLPTKQFVEYQDAGMRW